MAQLRGGTAPLEIETGMYVGIPAKQDMQIVQRGSKVTVTCPAQVCPASHLAMESFTPGFKDLCDRQKLIKNSKLYMLQTKTTKWGIPSLTCLWPETNC